MSKLSPKDLAKLTALAEQINAYYSMGADTAESAIVYHENRIIDKRTILEKFSDAREKQIQMWIDNRHGIRRMGQSVGSNMSYIYATAEKQAS